MGTSIASCWGNKGGSCSFLHKPRPISTRNHAPGRHKKGPQSRCCHSAARSPALPATPHTGIRGALPAGGDGGLRGFGNARRLRGRAGKEDYTSRRAPRAGAQTHSGPGGGVAQAHSRPGSGAQVHFRPGSSGAQPHSTSGCGTQAHSGPEGGTQAHSEPGAGAQAHSRPGGCGAQAR